MRQDGATKFRPGETVTADKAEETCPTGLPIHTVETLPALPVFAHELARALFDTDPDVYVFARERADAVCIASSTEKRLEYEGAASTIEVRVERIDDDRINRALDIAWDRDELGRATFWRQRVKEALERMGMRS